LRWDYVDDEFWGLPDDAVAVARRLSSGPTLVIVDPLSFYDPLVVARYGNYLNDVLDNGDAFVLILTPFAPPTVNVVLRNAIQVLAWRIFRHFYEPPAFTGGAYARCGPVGDEIELRGWLATALGPRLAPSSSTSPFLAPPRTG
jgi:hypothetical protein